MLIHVINDMPISHLHHLPQYSTTLRQQSVLQREILPQDLKTSDLNNMATDELVHNPQRLRQTATEKCTLPC